MKRKVSKEQIRKQIREIKEGYTSQELLSKSEEIFSVLEITGEFQKARNILIYHSLEDEVDTITFINKWTDKKSFYLPVVENDNLVCRNYRSSDECNKSRLGISEPLGKNIPDLSIIDLIIIPGIAFDRKMNRLGRGKGYYDKFLSGDIKAKKIGICFDFQLLDEIPYEEHDVKMDMIISENELIW